MTINGTSDQAPVVVDLGDLKSGSVPLHLLEEAFGPDSLGILVVRGLPPSFMELRSHVLSYSSLLAHLTENDLAKLENADAKYLVGWSLGKETLKDGRFDTAKGSYYVNCAFYQDPTKQNAPDEGRNFPEYTAPNLWPGENVLPGFRRDCEELCSLIIDTATLVARACDQYAQKNVPEYSRGYLERVVRTSMTTKARLLHYFPVAAPTKDARPGSGEDDVEDDGWCATHLDHGCLTGLTSAMYIDEESALPKLTAGTLRSHVPLPELQTSPDPKAGLYIHSRSNKITQVRIPKDCLAFQTGEALELITKGKFKAVPHFVRGLSSAVPRSQNVARNTLAVFTQPNLSEIVDADRGLDFADFSSEVTSRHQEAAD